MKRWSFLFSLGMLFLLVGLPHATVQAACPLPAQTNTSIGANTCTIAAVSGIDVVSGSNNTGVLTLDNAASLITINNGGELRVGSVAITAGHISIQVGGILKTNAALYVTDADSDGYPADLTLANATGVNLRRLGDMTTLTLDANDAQACADGANPGTCKTCATGAISNVASGSDTNGDCGAIDCHTGVTKYYNGWASNTCYYKADVSAATASCDGAGACKTAAVECAASTQGVSTGVTRSTCQTQVGCTGTTAGSTGYVGSGSDTYSDCNASQCNSGNCNGAGACAPVANGLEGTCATCTKCNGSSLTCVNVTDNTQDTVGTNQCTATCKRCYSGVCQNQTAGSDLFNQCAASSTSVYLNSGDNVTCSTVCNAQSCNTGVCGTGACATAACTCKSIGTDAGGTNGYAMAEDCVAYGGKTCSLNLSNGGGAFPLCSGIQSKWAYCKCGP